METIICYAAGTSTGTPGLGAIGVYITDAKGITLCEEAQTIGNASTIFAEYNAVLLALQTLQSMFGEATKTTAVEIRLDSEVIKKQLNAESQITEPGLVPMFIEIHNLRVASFPFLSFKQVSSEENSAHQLVTEALGAQ